MRSQGGTRWFQAEVASLKAAYREHLSFHPPSGLEPQSIKMDFQWKKKRREKTRRHKCQGRRRLIDSVWWNRAFSSFPRRLRVRVQAPISSWDVHHWAASHWPEQLSLPALHETDSSTTNHTGKMSKKTTTPGGEIDACRHLKVLKKKLLPNQKSETEDQPVLPSSSSRCTFTPWFTSAGSMDDQNIPVSFGLLIFLSLFRDPADWWLVSSSTLPLKNRKSLMTHVSFPVTCCRNI